MQKIKIVTLSSLMVIIGISGVGYWFNAGIKNFGFSNALSLPASLFILMPALSFWVEYFKNKFKK
jgi:hypothetical protein